MMMTRALPFVTALTAVLLVAGCTPAPSTPSASTTPSPSAPSTASSTPTPTASASAAPAAPADPLVGTCDELLTPEQIASLFSADAVSQGDLTLTGPGGRASTEEDILALMPSPGRHCAWVIPGTEAGMIVSVLRADAGVRAAVAAETAAFFTADAGPGVTYHSFGSLDGFIFTETHALGDGATDYWVAVFTSESNAREIAEVVWLDLIGT
jgi:hypothetical protein